MAWIRIGDTGALHPIVLAVLEHDDCDDRLVNEVAGFALRCAMQSGAHNTDYVVSRGTAITIAGHSRARVLIPIAIFAGYMTEVEVDGKIAYKIIDDDPDFIHLRLKEEIEFERQRRADNSNPAIIVPVRIRDGDACRWCGRVVDWRSRNAGRSGTYDHLEAGVAADVDTSVVCCRSCNSSKKDGTTPRNIAQLLPAPTQPYYSKATIEFLDDNEWRKKNEIPLPARSRKAVKPGDLAPGIKTPVEAPSVIPAAAPAAPATAVVTPGLQPGSDGDVVSVDSTPPVDTPAPTAQRTGIQPENATPNQRPDSQSESATSGPLPAPMPSLQKVCRDSADPADGLTTDPVCTGRGGPGLDGAGRVGSGTAGTSPPTPRDDPIPSIPERSSSPRRRRSRRRGNSTRRSS